jgi:hypothetical protein
MFLRVEKLQVGKLKSYKFKVAGWEIKKLQVLGLIVGDLVRICPK